MIFQVLPIDAQRLIWEYDGTYRELFSRTVVVSIAAMKECQVYRISAGDWKIVRASRRICHCVDSLEQPHHIGTAYKEMYRRCLKIVSRHAPIEVSPFLLLRILDKAYLV